MKTNDKRVIAKVQEHVLESFTPEDYNVETSEQAITEQINYMRIGNDNNYQTALHLVQGGSFLIYHYQVKDFLNSLGINPDNKEYTDQQSWDLYCHLVAREIQKIVNAQVYA